MAKFFCIFDGRTLVQKQGYDTLKCSECDTEYSSQFLDKMLQERAKNRHPSHRFRQNEIH